MTSPARIKRRARDRSISITLAVLIGLILGIGGWLVWQRQTGPLTLSTITQIAVPAKLALLPHKALYSVTMVSARNGSQIINIDGKMFFQMHQGCDAYITDHRFVLTYDYADSEPMRITSDFSTIESEDGQSFDFSSRRRRDGELYQELKGKVALTKLKGGEAIYAEPANLHFNLDPGTLLPATHTRALIDAAKAGKKFLSSRIFDGSDEEGPVDVTAVISEKSDVLTTLSSSPALAREPLKTKAWKIHLAFFPLKSETDTADYELSMVLHENGVISDMVIDYQDFSVHQRLLALEPLASEPCTPMDGEGRTQEDIAPSKPPGDRVPDRPLR